MILIKLVYLCIHIYINMFNLFEKKLLENFSALEDFVVFNITGFLRLKNQNSLFNEETISVYFYEARKNKNSITLLYFKQPKEISSESMMLAPKDTAPLQPLMFYGPCLCSPPGWRKGACPCFSLHLQTIEPF